MPIFADYSLLENIFKKINFFIFQTYDLFYGNNYFINI